MTQVLVTGANGFVGRQLCGSLLAEGYQVRGLVRSSDRPLDGVDYRVAELTDAVAMPSVLTGIDVVFHLAGRAHVMSETTADPLEDFRRVNCQAALEFAKSCLVQGVKRFVFVSSIGVNGAETRGAPFSENAQVAPHAPYAVSKWEAEQALKSLFAGTATELVIVRPPLVYAAQAPGNFKRLLQLVATGLPLPFGAVRNARSMVSLVNLASFLCLCVKHPNAAGELFLVSDGESLSLPEILRCLGQGMGKSTRLVSIPVSWMGLAAKAAGKTSMFNQLCGSLVIDSEKSQRLLGWTPPVCARDALIAAGREYRDQVAAQRK